mgnify:CR=1 FL=1
MRTDILLLIAGMTLVTYIPRMLPAVLLEKLHFGPKVEKFLQLIPYTAMTALVFPGVFSVDANPVLGVVGAAVAGGLAWKKCPIIVCVLAAVAVEAVMLLVQGSGMLWSVVVVAG